LEGTLRYLGIEVDDALEISERNGVYQFQRFGRLAARPVASRPEAVVHYLEMPATDRNSATPTAPKLPGVGARPNIVKRRSL
jgi:hypothetical protein